MLRIFSIYLLILSCILILGNSKCSNNLKEVTCNMSKATATGTAFVLAHEDYLHCERPDLLADYFEGVFSDVLNCNNDKKSEILEELKGAEKGVLCESIVSMVLNIAKANLQYGDWQKFKCKLTSLDNIIPKVSKKVCKKL